jgi:hypothetical protein
MAHRLLNIASIVCLVLCVTLMGMWIRSYRSLDVLVLDGPWWGKANVDSIPGRLELGQHPEAPPLERWSWKCIASKYNSNAVLTNVQNLKQLGIWGFHARFSWSGSVMAVPYWFLVLVTGMLAMAFRFRWPLRFTLRSLFVVTTFFAIVLGMSVWLDRAWIGK